jgi:hypothetical protein
MSKASHSSGIVWDEALGMGYYAVEGRGQYNDEYWRRYQGYKTSEIGAKLNSKRLLLVRSHCPPGSSIVDVGIGNGHFVEAYGPAAYGYDVNPVAIEWLCKRKAWWDPHHADMPSASFWDSIEHVARPSELIGKVKRLAFISIPIFTDLDHVLRSKHFRKDEHFWYFTEHGLERWMSRRGFSLEEKNRMEEECGREDIGTFVFKRVSAGPPELW